MTGIGEENWGGRERRVKKSAVKLCAERDQEDGIAVFIWGLMDCCDTAIKSVDIS